MINKYTNLITAITFFVVATPGVSYATDTENKNIRLITSQINNVVSKEDARAAILQMAGTFDVNFSFEEIYSQDAHYKLKAKTNTKGKEVIFPIIISENKISLQHLLIIPNGEIVKHWRQDWSYEPDSSFEYSPDYKWTKIKYSPDEVKGKWLQTVWNSDDSPRYAALGTWSNATGMLMWTSNLTTKPLPRREYSKRNDYDLMKSINRHIITPFGWIQEEDNWKYISNKGNSFVKETGINTYTSNKNLDKKAATTYWDNHKKSWAEVRRNWELNLDKNGYIQLKKPNEDDNPHYIYILDQINRYNDKDQSEKSIDRIAKETIEAQLIKNNSN